MGGIDEQREKDEAIAFVFEALQDCLPQLAHLVNSDALGNLAFACQRYHLTIAKRRAERRTRSDG